ncbi:MAG: hypothetical protein K2V38_13980 [Gemmataceae bacterium]|nr:hypothetical protein [Gemmataceae bacterium]
MSFVVIDFEATCDEPYNPDPQEIIEFPAVLVSPGDPADGTEFHTYVRPVRHPRLTAFCTQLTGIGQTRVDAAPTFPEALHRFEAWRAATCPAAYLVACGNWDLASLLPRQCAQHDLGVPAWADGWADLKALFAESFPNASDRATLAEIASALGVGLVGRAHSGIDDARNIARVLRVMLGRGVNVRNTALWRCSGCGCENLMRDGWCERCAAARDRLLPGDWRCSRCGCGNFARRDKCFDCGVRRDGHATATRELKRGDWLCPGCGEHNFARRERCFKCAAPR